MTKKEKELEHDRATLQMMANVSRHAEVQQAIAQERPVDPKVYYVMAFCAGMLTTVALLMLMVLIG